MAECVPKEQQNPFFYRGGPCFADDKKNSATEMIDANHSFAEPAIMKA